MRLALGFPLKAEEAYQYGLAQWLVPHEQLMERAFEIAGRIASLPPLAARLDKESLVRGIVAGTLANTALDAVSLASLPERTPAATETPRAWGERRPPAIPGQYPPP